MIVRLAVAAAVVAVALDGGGYSLVSRHTLALIAWWGVLVGVATGILPRARPARAGLAVAGLLCGLLAWTAASLAWSGNAEGALVEVDRVALYVAVYLLAILGLTSADVPPVCDGIALGAAGVAGLALGSRFLPDLFPEPDIPRFLPNAATRLAYPLGYWNALAILLAIAVPLVLRAAVEPGSNLRRAAAVGVLPAIAATVYLTSSRGGAATAVAAALLFLALTPRRWQAAAALGVGAAGAAASILVLTARPELVDGPLGTADAEEAGRTAALLLSVTCAATGAAYGAGCRLLQHARSPRPAVGWGLAALAAACALAGLVAADPVERFRTFREPPSELAGDITVRAHLLSAGGSGRWQFWETALDAFERRPLFGHGAGSYEAWWAENGSLAYFVRDAHSLYLETLGELGVIGFALLAGALALGLGAGIRLILSGRGEVAAPVAAAAAFYLAAGIDWVWEMPAVGIVGIACLGLAAVGRSGERPRVAVPFRIGVAAACVAPLVAVGLPLFAQLELERSRVDAGRGDLVGAL